MPADRRPEMITLVGGPGGGQKFEIRGPCDTLKWVPKDPADFAACQEHGFSIGHSTQMQPLLYRRSLRTPSKFVFQP